MVRCRRSGDRSLHGVPVALAQALGELQRFQVLQQLLHPAGTEDHRGHPRVAQAPGDRQRRRRDTRLVGDAGEGTGTLEPLVLLGHDLPSQPLQVVPREAGITRDAVVVLAGEQAGGQRGPDRRAHSELPVQRCVLLLDPLAMQQVVLRLLHGRRMQMVARGDRVRLADQFRRPLRGAPIQDLPLPDQRVHRPHCFLDRHVRVGPVAVEQIQALDPQPLQGVVAGLGDVLARQAPLGRARVGGGPEEHFAGHTEAVPRQSQVGDDVAHDPLGLAIGVSLGIVEEVDSVVPGGGDQLACRATAELVAEGDPGTKGQGGQLKAGRAEAAVLHGRLRDAERGALQCSQHAGGTSCAPAPRYARHGRSGGPDTMMQGLQGLHRLLGRLAARPDWIVLELGAGGELLVARVRLVVAALLLLLPLVNILTGGSLDETLIGLACAIVINLLSLLWLQLARGPRRYPWLAFVTTAFDVTLVTLVLALLAWRHPAAGLNSMVVWCCYALAIMFTALRGDGRVSVFSGALALLQYGVLATVVIATADTPERLLSSAYGMVTGGTQLQRLALLAMVTAVTAVLAFRMQRLVLSSGHDGLTGLPNRTWLVHRAPALLAEARAQESSLSLALLN